MSGPEASKAVRKGCAHVDISTLVGSSLRANHPMPGTALKVSVPVAQPRRQSPHRTQARSPDLRYPASSGPSPWPRPIFVFESYCVTSPADLLGGPTAGRQRDRPPR